MTAEFDEEHYAFARKEVKELLHENWPTVLRIGRHLERHDLLTPEQLLGSISHELCLQYRDIPTVRTVLASNCNSKGRVDLARLKECVAEHGMVPYAASLPRVTAATAVHATTAAATKHQAGGPPYAIKGDHLVTQSQHRTGLEGKKKAFRAAVLAAAAGSNTISRTLFFKTMNKLDHYGMSYREAQDIFTVLDPKRTGSINVQEFCDRFTFEFLKPKSMRNTLGSHGSDGFTNAFEWPATLHSPQLPSSNNGSPRAASARGLSRANSAVRGTRASQLRRAVAEVTRVPSFPLPNFDADAPSEKELPPASEYVLGAIASARLAEAASIRIPRPPLNSARVRTRVTADAVLLGNVLPEVAAGGSPSS